MGRLIERLRKQWWTALVATLALSAACSVSPPPPSVDDLGEAVGGSVSEARAIAIRWLELARTGADDLGWSLLYPTTRTDVIQDEGRYRQAIQGGDWSQFRYVVRGTDVEDGEYRVRIAVPGGPESVPDSVAKWGLIQFVSADGVVGDSAFLIVRIAPSGFPYGVQATG